MNRLEMANLLYCSAGCSRSNHALSALPDPKGADEPFVAYASANFVSIVGRRETNGKEAFSLVRTPSLRNPNAEVSSIFWYSNEFLTFGHSDGTLVLYSVPKNLIHSEKCETLSK